MVLVLWLDDEEIAKLARGEDVIHTVLGADGARVPVVQIYPISMVVGPKY